LRLNRLSIALMWEMSCDPDHNAIEFEAGGVRSREKAAQAALANRLPGRSDDDYWPCFAIASAIFAFTASRLKDAPFCMGG
jgi:hypothetical protein